MKHNNIPNSVWTKLDNNEYELNKEYCPERIKVKVIPTAKGRYKVCAMIRQDPTGARFFMTLADGATHRTFKVLDNAKWEARTQAQTLTPDLLKSLK